MTDQSYIRHNPSGQPLPATTIRYIGGEYVTKQFDPDDETEQVDRGGPLPRTWEHQP